MLIMSGIDYSLAGIDVREKFAFTKANQAEIYSKIKQDKDVYGAVIVSTCNRTEIYLSCDESYNKEPFDLLCDIIEVGVDSYPHKSRSGDELFWHLCRLASGAKSQIWGEDQIISQVKASIILARENNAADNKLEVLFRTAITCAKKIKTEIKFSKSESSIALKSLSILQKHYEVGQKVLIIGNGEVGKLTAKTLVENGFKVTMTLRQYKYSEAILPDGVSAFEYAERYEHLGEFDILISSTLSPHYTIEKSRLKEIKLFPKLMLDLAVPRDIEPSVADIEGVLLYDVDLIGKDVIEKNHGEQLLQIDEIIKKYHEDYKKWCIHANLNKKAKERVFA